MTALVLNYSTSLLDGFLSISKTVYNVLKKLLQGIMIGWMVSRQTGANQYVAQQLIKYGEYRQEDYHNLLHELNRKTISNIHKEVTGE